MKRQKYQGTRINRQERRDKAVKMRIGGSTFQQIGDELGITRSSAFKMVKRAFDTSIRKMGICIETEIYLDLERLNQAISRLWTGIESGDPQAVNALVKVIDHRAKLLGLYAKDRKDESEYSEEELNKEIDRLIYLEATDLFNEWVDKGKPSNDCH